MSVPDQLLITVDANSSIIIIIIVIAIMYQSVIVLLSLINKQLCTISALQLRGRCSESIPRNPANSESIYTTLDFTSDAVDQLFICFVGYEVLSAADKSSKVLIHRTCRNREWFPSQIVDCLPSMCLFILYVLVANTVHYLFLQAPIFEL